MKNLIMGIVIGVSLGITPIAFSAYYSSNTSASDLTASELKSVIQDALDSCTVTKELGYSSGGEYFEIDC
ncbi:uncharacterized protein METZ01_LOCUS379939 [marine metagenome]|uniref:Uncharacterized protein n=1 Tax=marine metagenome TaxID=408172 RepID=A0A382TZG5_9ZZZZ